MTDQRRPNYENALKTIKFSNRQFVDNRIFRAASEFLDEKRRTVSGNHQTIYGAINQYKTLIRMFFDDVRLENITREFILTKLEDHSGPWYLRLHCMWEFLFYMKHQDLLREDWDQLLHLEALLCTGRKSSFSRTVLSVEDCSRYEHIANTTTKKLYYLDTDNPVIRKLMMAFINRNGRSFQYITKTIFSFLFKTQGFSPSSVEDIDYKMFLNQMLKLADNPKRKEYFQQLIKFYRFIYTDYNPNLFSESTEFDARLLQRKGLASKLAEGYRIVPYNPLEPYPSHDRWIVSFYNSAEQYGKNMTLTSTLNFTAIKSKEYRDYLKKYLWSSPVSWQAKPAIALNIICFLNYMSDLKSGRILTVFTHKTKESSFLVSEVAAYRQYIISKYSNIKTQAHYLSDATALLKLLRESSGLKIDRGVLEQLKVKSVCNTDKMAIPDEDLNRIAEVMRKYAQKNIRFELYYSVFYLALETEFRISQIVNLEAHCVRETLKNGQYVILSKTKTSHGEYKEQAITSYTKRHLDEIHRLTEPFRQRCTDSRMRQLLFLEPYEVKGIEFRPLGPQCFNRHLKNCCIEARTRPYAFSNLRDTHMTKAEEFIIRKGLSDMYLKVLTDHKSSETTKIHYSQIQLTEILEAVHGIIIGDVHLEGSIVQNPILSPPEEESVSNGCGYCKNAVCTTTSYLDCLMCPHFVTMPARIPYFDEQLKSIDQKIKNTPIAHDKEDLVMIKRLLAAYQRELLRVKEETQHASDH